MSSLLRLLTMTAALLVAVVQQTAGAPILFGTVGAGNVPSTLVVINPANGALLSTVGAVGFTVNGLAWDPRSQQLYATTSVRDLHFHGLITINPLTGVGTPVDSSVINFGLGAGSSPIHSITIDVLGQMVGWYDEVPPATSDTFVRINKHTGVATEFPNTGIDTAQNGLSFSDLNFLWNIDSPLQHPDGTFTQTAYLINPLNGKPFFSKLLFPPTIAALGDFNPVNHLYYGLNFNVLGPDPLATDLVVVNLLKGTVTTIGPTVRGLHVIAFAQVR